MKMGNSDASSSRPPLSVPFFYGWFIVALSFVANLTAAGIRSAPFVLIHPLEDEFGWSRTAIAAAASLNLLLLGLFAACLALIIRSTERRDAELTATPELAGASR